MYALGADISRWQDNNSTPQMFDFEKGKANGLKFVFIKASQSNWTDEDIILNWNNAKAAEILRGAYHFLVWETDPIVQADCFVDTIDHDPGELPPVADFEWWRETPLNAYTILRRFCERVESKLGRTPLIYTAPGFWQPYGTGESYWAHYGLWVAAWGTNTPRAEQPTWGPPLVPRPWNTWTFWQWTSKGDGLKFGAESLDLDLNYYNGDVKALYQYAGVTPPEDNPDYNNPDYDKLMEMYLELKGDVDKLKAWKERPL